ncbi:hypothetical protein PTKU64_82380 [Paraburkholderia terrae]|uniref:Lipoprotein n=1 Tax=Paraburkholderia terrae TaxID=311230 RepID=A0ABN6JUP5_9BURK|nr:hypothetical protein PTKU64_82380 [Paraburkholderia terrae]BDC45814.1 hypothetical protein PTKU15_91110 [Paraburkholderia terrae]
MGIGMQIIYLGLPGSASLEAEAAIQLLRLQPFSAGFSDCRLEIEQVGQSCETSMYEVRLEVTTLTRGLRRIGRCVRDSAEAAIRCAFNRAVRVLAVVATRGNQ